MAKGYYRTNDDQCLYCGHSEMKDYKKVRMPWKIGKGKNKTFLCDKCFNKTEYSKEQDIERYKNK